jgi:hypothetical protein
MPLPGADGPVAPRSGARVGPRRLRHGAKIGSLEARIVPGPTTKPPQTRLSRKGIRAAIEWVSRSGIVQSAMFGASSPAAFVTHAAWRVLRASLGERRRSLALLVASLSLGAFIPGLAGAFGHSRSSVQPAAAPTKVAEKLAVCPDAGCTSGVTVGFSGLRSNLPGARSITLCVVHHCVRESALRSESVLIAVRWRDTPALGTGPYNVLVLVRNKKHKVLLRVHRRVILKRIQPNGANCPPTCFASALVLDAKHRRLDLVHTSPRR